MAYFRLRSDAEKWFKKVDKGPKFDIYYYCALVGLMSRRRNEPAGEISKDVIDYFITDFKPYKNLIIGLIIIAELKKSYIDLNEKSAVREVISRIVAPGDTGLTDNGIKLLNQYASGGFDYLIETGVPKPETREEFMLSYVNIIRDCSAGFGFHGI
ncbi:hypothetical protein [Sphingorhabdus sp.]|jgi:hypothetical protein|uniref:hypothetical protein n=1 Tax=Sphingorhabdus sp. TaxID=1902408 RepID=UPI0037C9ED7F